MSEFISLVILFSVGFTSAKVLATKIVYLYNLSNSQLSQQDHYDFGMRAIKAVLLMAGEIKRSHIKDSNLTDEQSEVEFLFLANLNSIYNLGGDYVTSISGVESSKTTQR